MKHALEQAVEEILAPLFAVDGASISLRTVSDARVELEVRGIAAVGAGHDYIKENIIEPVIRKIVGDQCEIVVHKAVSLPKKNKEEA